MLKKLKKELLTYTHIQLEHLKKELNKKIGTLKARLMFNITFFTLLTLSLTFLGISLAMLVAELCGSYALGFALASFVYIIPLFTILVFKKSFKKFFIKRYIKQNTPT